MSRDRTPVTPAIRALRAAKVEFRSRTFDYDRHPGAVGAAEAVGVDPHAVIKTLVFVTADGDGVIVLEHGDHEVSAKNLARILEVKAVQPADQVAARRWTGYEFGGTSPFGLAQPLPILADVTIANLEVIHINAGKRGFLIEMRTADLIRLLDPRLEDVRA